MFPPGLPLPLRLEGDALEDETQLDGRRHLTLELTDEPGDWLATLHCILDLEGADHEAELELEGPHERVWSGALDGTPACDWTERLILEASFVDEDGARLQLELEESDAAAFRARCTPGRPGSHGGAGTLPP